MVDNFVVPATLVSFVYVEVGCVEFEIRSPFQIARQCVWCTRVWTDMAEKEITFGIISQTHMRERK